MILQNQMIKLIYMNCIVLILLFLLYQSHFFQRCDFQAPRSYLVIIVGFCYCRHLILMNLRSWLDNDEYHTSNGSLSFDNDAYHASKLSSGPIFLWQLFTTWFRFIRFAANECIKTVKECSLHQTFYKQIDKEGFLCTFQNYPKNLGWYQISYRYQVLVPVFFFTVLI
jgi:hypothetical protein